ncbi:hypothetical protein MKQ68_07785 [Chitinophaga horti]|uniref:WG containing repeat-containing protein n=1 Tax=Chitinophaga horti TaxID=2920382 RepID=A0ABY6J5V2_9BACT|nr:cell envelope integrity protein TolA [Chitinophaga horti]UYQ94993.1 hypothetical protein MKQ68_07785 [Chitinophaga horti]
MLKTTAVFLILLLFSATSYVSAQSHIGTTGSFCRYAKNSLRDRNIYREGHTQCPACDLEDEKEEVARRAEDKRRQDVKNAAIAAQRLAEKKAQEELLKKKREADKGVTEVAVTMPADKKTVNNAVAASPAVGDGMLAGYFYDEAATNNQSLGHMIFHINQGERNNQTYKLYSDVNYFVLNNKRILDNNEFKACIGVRRLSDKDQGNAYQFPAGVGIVILNEINGEHVIADLVDVTGKRLLKDDNISTIVHFYGDYFILLEGKVFTPGSYPHASFQFDDGVIYNYKTKQRHPLARYSETRVSVGWHVNATYLPKNKLRDKSTYNAFLEVHTGWNTSSIYYITNEGKVASDAIH